MIFVVICAVAIVASTVSVLRDRGHASAVPGTPSALPHMPVPRQGLSDGSFLLFVSTTHDSDYGRLGLVAMDDPDRPARRHRLVVRRGSISKEAWASV